MKKNILMIGGAVVAVVVIAAAAYVWRLRSEAAKWSGPVAEILEEQTEARDGATYTRYVSVIDAPLPKVEEVLWRLEDSSRLVENIRKSELRSQSGNTKVIEMHFQALKLPVQVAVMEFTRDPARHRVTFRTVQSRTVDLTGSYALEPSPDGKKTRVIYEVTRRDKVPLPVPKDMVEAAGRETFVRTVRGLRKALGGAG